MVAGEGGQQFGAAGALHFAAPVEALGAADLEQRLAVVVLGSLAVLLFVHAAGAVAAEVVGQAHFVAAEGAVPNGVRVHDEPAGPRHPQHFAAHAPRFRHVFGDVRRVRQVERVVPERQFQPRAAHRGVQGDAGGRHFADVGFAGEVADAPFRERPPEVAGPAADVQDAGAAQGRWPHHRVGKRGVGKHGVGRIGSGTRGAFRRAQPRPLGNPLEEGDGVVGEVPVEPIRVRLLVLEGIEQAQGTLQGAMGAEGAQRRRGDVHGGQPYGAAGEGSTESWNRRIAESQNRRIAESQNRRIAESRNQGTGGEPGSPRDGRG